MRAVCFFLGMVFILTAHCADLNRAQMAYNAQDYKTALSEFIELVSNDNRYTAGCSNTQSANMLGQMYFQGQGVVPSRVVAYALFNCSIAGYRSQYNPATSFLSKLKSNLSAAEIEAAQNLSNEMAKPRNFRSALENYIANPTVQEQSNSTTNNQPSLDGSDTRLPVWNLTSEVQQRILRTAMEPDEGKAINGVVSILSDSGVLQLGAVPVSTTVFPYPECMNNGRHWAELVVMIVASRSIAPSSDYAKANLQSEWGNIVKLCDPKQTQSLKEALLWLGKTLEPVKGERDRLKEEARIARIKAEKERQQKLEAIEQAKQAAKQAKENERKAEEQRQMAQLAARKAQMEAEEQERMKDPAYRADVDRKRKIVGVWKCVGPEDSDVAFFSDGTYVSHAILAEYKAEILMAGRYTLDGQRLTRTWKAARFLQATSDVLPKDWSVAKNGSPSNNPTFTIYEDQIIALSERKLEIKGIRVLNIDGHGKSVQVNPNAQRHICNKEDQLYQRLESFRETIPRQLL